MFLQISELEKLDFSGEDSSALNTAAGIVQGLFVTNNAYMQSLAKVWDTNIRFFEGDQWIYYDNYIGQNLPIPLIQGVNDWIPRPVSNYILPTIYTIASVLTKSKPTALVFPNSDEAADITAAKVGEAILDTKWELDGEDVLAVRAALILLLCGTVFRKDYWDPSASTTNIEPEGLEEQIPSGDTKTEIKTPFEVYPDIYGETYFIEASVTPIETIRKLYGKSGNGYTGRAHEVKRDKTYSTVLQYRENLRTLTPAYYGMGTAGSSNYENSDTAVLVECYIKPTNAFPKGLMIVEANGIPLYVADSPYYDPKVEDSWHPYTVCKWSTSPTKYHGISLTEQIVPHQRRINSIDSFITLANMTSINPVWLINKESNIPEGSIDGRPGLNVYYTGEPPVRMPGVQLPNDIWKERERLVQDLHFIAGDNLVLHGERPEGVSTASGLQLLMEQSAGKFGPYYINWEKFFEKGQQKKLLLIARNYVDERPDFLAKIKHFARNTNDIDIKNFVGSDLRDNFTIRIEAGSSIPRSKLVEQQQLLDMQQRGLLGDVSPQANPVANQQFLEKFGIRQFQGITNPDLVKANYVIGVLKQIDEGKLPQEDYPPFLPFENVDIHMNTLVDEMKKPEFKDKMGVFQRKFQELLAAKEAQMQSMMPPPMPIDPNAMPPEEMPMDSNAVQDPNLPPV